MNNIEKLQSLIDEAKRITVITGAGVSTDSGIKDFRSKEGLYNISYRFLPETILSHSFFINNTKEFYRFYLDKMDARKANPNIVHKYLKELEDKNKLSLIITQNIDGLHSIAGNKKLVELHGSIYRNYCMKCHKYFDASYVFNCKDIPYCECGGLIKPDVVLYEEQLDHNDLNNSIKALHDSDLLLILGTSLKVYPANSLLVYYGGKDIVIINNDGTDYDRCASLVINKPLKEVFTKIK